MISSTLFEDTNRKQKGLLNAHSETFGNNNLLVIINPNTTNQNFGIEGVVTIDKLRRINLVQIPTYGNTRGSILMFIQYSTNIEYLQTLKKHGL